MNTLFEHFIKSEDITFKYAKGRSTKLGKEFHVFHEIVLFIDGSAEFTTESIHTKIPPNTLIVIPKETYHQIAIHEKQEEYCRCLINFYDIPELSGLIARAMKQPIIIQTDKNIEYLFKKLIKNLSETDAKYLLKSVLALLLSEIVYKSNTYVSETSQNVLVTSAVQYINSNLTRKITIEEIAKECMISPSALSHVFKKEMNIPLHKFIVKKRLINAYHRIMSGEPAMVAAIDCGFNDYSGFYKQYKKMFGVSPSEKIKGFKKT